LPTHTQQQQQQRRRQKQQKLFTAVFGSRQLRVVVLVQITQVRVDVPLRIIRAHNVFMVIYFSSYFLNPTFFLSNPLPRNYGR